MSEFWVSKKKYWCRYCECFIADDKPSRTQHENGLRHQGNKERYVRQIYKSGEKRKRDLEEEKREMAVVDRAAQSAYAEDIAAGRGGASSLHSAAASSASRQPAASSKQSNNPFANYSTAASLGYKDDEAERAVLLAEQRSKEGTVGAWEVVVPPPPPLTLDDGIKTVGGEDEAEVDVKPQSQPEPTQVDDGDFRSFKVRQKKASFVSKSLGSLYDPGEIVIKKKQKVEEQESGSFEPDSEVKTSSLEPKLESEAVEERGSWQALDEKVNPTVVLHRPREPTPEGPPPAETEKVSPPFEVNGAPSIKPEDAEDVKPTIQESSLPSAENNSEAPSGGGSLFKRKIKRPVYIGYLAKMSLSSLANFHEWFTSQGGTLNPELVGFAEFEDGGRGAVALRNIPENTTLFRLPRHLALSTRTSSLPGLIRTEWRKYKLGKGWVGLILCMLWEEGREAGKWRGYFEGLPQTFETPMFWSEDEIKYLKGTAVHDKIGREDAESDFREKVVPVIKSRPEIFNSPDAQTRYTVENYHRMGSLILSRSFHVERYEADSDEADGGNLPLGTLEEGGQPMDVDGEDAQPDGNEGEPDDETLSEGDSEDEENPEDVAMVPMADILNARYGCANAKLFYEERDLGMIAVCDIKAGEQIWNTYGDPPNSDLFRRYGHIDLLPLEDGGLGNPADIVEVRADLVTKAVKIPEQDVQERVDWWLEEGGDDVFIFDRSFKPPELIISFIRLMNLGRSEWMITQKKGKLPKPRMDSTVSEVCTAVLQARLQEYPTTLEEDAESLQARGPSMSSQERVATHIRFGEKEILALTLRALEDGSHTETEKKRKASGTPGLGQNGTKKSKR